MTDDAKSTTWTEVVPDGEAEQFARFAREITQYQDEFARRGDGTPHRGFHVKYHAGVSAEFTVPDDIPAAAKHGVFAQAKTFPAWLRISNGASGPRHDWMPDLVGFAVKLTGVDGPKLLPGEEHAQTQDFVTLNQPYVPATTAEHLMIISLSSANLLSAPLKLVRGLGLPHAVQVMLWTVRWSLRRLFLKSVVTEDYSSEVPITLGPHAVKFKWQSRRNLAPSRVSLWRYDRLREDLRQRLSDGDVTFDFLVQFYADPHTTPIEGAAAWNEAEAPFVKLAELTVRRRDLTSAAAQDDERYVNGLAFDPWHALAAHRPLGGIQRARNVVYRASAEHRGRAADPTT